MKSATILLASAFVLPCWCAAADAHEGHAPLPSKGATVRGDRLMLSPSASKAIGVTIGKVELADIQRVTHAIASVELPWSQQAFVTSLISGKVTHVLVKPGETVAAGQELARIESLELENLQLAMLQASTELSFTSRLLVRHERLGADNIIPGRVVLATRTEVRKNQARLNSAWQKMLTVGLARDTLRRIRVSGERIRTISITSPIAGIVSAADVRPGRFVQPNEHLFHIVDPSRVWVVGKILEADAGQMRSGLPLRVTFAMLPDKQFTAPVDHVELKLNENRTLSVKAYLDNPDGSLKPGMFGRVQIQTGGEKAVVCPKNALIRDGLTRYALVQESAGRYVRKRVDIGLAVGPMVEIKDGLFPGDRVVTTGSHELAALFGSDASKTQAGTENMGPRRPSAARVTIAQGRIELPTDQKRFASAPIDGRIRRILVEHGQRVEQGQVLAEVESMEFQSLQLKLLEARATLAQASANLQRLNTLAQANAIAQKDLWELQSQHGVYKHSAEALRHKLSLIGLSAKEIDRIEQTDIANLDSPKELTAVLPIRAPGDGLIAQFDIIPGQVVEADRSLFEIHNPSKMWVQAYLFEQDALGIEVGQPVQVSLVADPAFRATGSVDRVNPVLASGSRALSIWIELDNADLRLKEDMSAVVAIRTGKPAARIAERGDREN